MINYRTLILTCLISSSLMAQNPVKMKNIRTEIIIDASAETVWQILTDFESYGNWNPFVVSIEGEAKENAGLKAQLMIKEGKAMTIRPKVTDIKNNKRFEWYGTTPLWMFNGRHFFEIEVVGRNQVKSIQGEYFTGWLKGAILRWVGDQTRAGFIAMNHALKEKAENQ